MSKFLKTLKRSRLATSSVALILAFSVLLSSFGGLTIFAGSSTENVWNGEAAELTQGTGDVNDPYIITTAGQLYKVATMTKAETEGKYFQLANDIYLNDVSTEGWYNNTGANEWTFAEKGADGYDTGKAFAGNFDGKGHVVHGLYVSEKTSYTSATPADTSISAGLFPLLAGGATVTAVGIEDSYISVTNSITGDDPNTADVDESLCTYGGLVGAIAGQIVDNADEDGKRVSVSLCYADETTRLEGYRIGLLGNSNDNSCGGVTLKDCYLTVAFSAYKYNLRSASYDADESNRPALIPGFSGSATYIGCWTIHNLYGNGGKANANSTNNYRSNWVADATGSTQIKATEMQGKDAVTKMPGLDWENVWIPTSSYPVLKVFVEAAIANDAIEIWDGTIASSLIGYGTETSPYLIRNGAELAHLVTKGDTYADTDVFSIAKDIYLNDVEKVDWASGNAIDYTPNSWFTTASATPAVAVRGTIKGNGHVIHGLYLNDATAQGSRTDGAGLFPVYGKVNISGLGIDDSYMQYWTNYSFGGIIGKANAEASGTVVDQCYVGANVTFKGYDIGGIIAGGDPAGDQLITIQNCYSQAKIDAANWGGGIISDVWSAEYTIRNVYSVGAPAVEKEFGQSTLENVYSSVEGNSRQTVLAAGDMKDTYAKEAMSALDFDTVFITVDDDYPDLRVFGRHLAESTPDNADIWDGTVATELKGEGTEAAPYEISTGAELAYAIKSGGAGKYYKLTQDIYLNDISKIDWTNGTVIDDTYTANEWFASETAAGTSYKGITSDTTVFSGTIDGNGKTVYGLYYKPGNLYTAVGLMPVATNTTVKNLQMKNSFISGGRWTSALIGYGTGSNGISQVVVDSSVTVWGYDVGNHYYDGGDIAWPFSGSIENVHFQSRGCGVIIGYAVGSVSVDNAAVYATIKKSHEFTTTNSFTNGGNPVKVTDATDCGAIIGTSWGTTISVTDTVSLAVPYNKQSDGSVNTRVFTDVYTTESGYVTGEKVAITKVDLSGITGAAAETNLPGLDWTLWKATTGYPTLVQFYVEPSDDEIDANIWDGTVSSGLEGSGTEADPYQITNGSDLAYVVTTGSSADKYYEFTDDIYLNDIEAIDWTTGELLDGTYTINKWYTATPKFEGTIKGNGHVVYGLYIKDTAAHGGRTDGAGLFPTYGEVYVTGLGIDSAYMEYQTNYSFGAMFGNGQGSGKGTIDQCYVGENVTLKGYDVGTLVGGGDIAGILTITNTYTLASVTATHRSGLVGDKWTSEYVVNSCYVVGTKLTGNSSPNDMEGTGNNYATNTSAGGAGITAADIKDTKGQENMPLLNWENVYITKDDSFPVLRIFGNTVAATPDGGVTPPPSDLADETPADTAFDQLPVWDGTVSKPAGSGTEADPYRISNAKNLAWAVKNGSGGADKFYKFTNDIILNKLDAVNWATGEIVESGYTPNTWYLSDGVSSKIQGTIIGNGKVVYGVYYNDASAHGGRNTGAGLFPLYGKVNVTGLGLESSYLYYETNYSLGAMFGKISGAAGTIVDQCYVSDTVTVKGYDASGMFGGANTSGTVTVTNSYVNATVLGSHWAGGFVADTWNWGDTPTVWVFKGCYTTSGNGIIGKNGQFDIAEGSVNNYATVIFESDRETAIVADKIKDSLGQDNMPGLDWVNVYITKDDSFPVLRVFGHTTPATPDPLPETPETPAGSTDLPIWDGVTLTAPNGSGTEADPYRISNAENLAYVVANGGESGAYYKLTNDIYLNDTTKINFATGEKLVSSYNANEWYRSTTANGTTYNNGRSFRGTIDGAGHTVYGMYYAPGNTYTAVGLIPTSDSATVKNLRIKDAYISGGRWTAAVSAYASKLTVSDVIVDHTVTINGYNAGNKYFAGALKNDGSGNASTPFSGNPSTGAVIFESSATSGIVAFASTAASITNTGVYAAITTSGFDYTTTNELTNGGQPAKVSASTKNGAFAGTAWNANVTITDSVSIYAPFKANDGNYTVSDVYTAAADNAAAGEGDDITITVLTLKKLQGVNSANNLTGLDFENTWKATKGYPTLIQFYSAEEDVEIPDPNPEPNEPVIWDGTTKTMPKGSGTKADPFRIASAANLAYVLNTSYAPGTYFIFVQDIYINDVSKIDWATGTPASGYTPNKWYTTTEVPYFNGIVDGNGKMVYGLYIKDTTAQGSRTDGAGLFPGVYKASVKDLGVDKAYLEYYTNYSFGTIFGRCTSATGSVDGCFVGADVTVKGYDAGAILGGGDTATGGFTISNSYSLATVNAAHRGGLVGDQWTSEYTLTGNYTVGAALLGNGSISGTSGTNYSTVSGNGATVVSANKILGANAADIMPMLDWDTYFVTVDGKYPILKRFADYKTSEYWSGGEIEPSVGTGTKDDPYIISTGEELAWVVKNGSAAGVYYKLANDIYLNDLNKLTWYTGTVQEGYTVREWYTSDEVEAFAGNFDGNGYHVYGLYYGDEAVAAPTGSVGAGLFPLAGSGITVDSLGIEKAYLEHYTNYSLGAIIGKLDPSVAGKISNTYVGDSVTVKGYDAGAFIGGGFRTTNFTIEDSYSQAVLDYSHAGGLVGDTWSNTGANGEWIVNRVYVAGVEIVQGEESDGIKLFGNNGSATVTNAYAAKGPVSGLSIISIDEMVGMSAISENMPGLGEAFRATESFPVLMAFTSSDIYATDENGVWTGILPFAFSDDGKGTKDDPILINYPGDLALAIGTGGNGKYYKLTEDIYLNYANTKRWFEASGLNEWSNISGATFNGHIDGDGYCVYGLYIPAGYSGYAGLIGKMSGGSVKNLGVRYAQVNSKGSGAGGIIGYAAGHVEVDQCFTDESVTVTCATAGGIIGLAMTNNPTEDKAIVVTNSYSKAAILGASAGKGNGIIGNPWRTPYEIYNCYSTGFSPYSASGAGFRSATYWFFTDAVKKDGEVVKEAISYHKEGKVASDYFKNIYTDTGTPDGQDNFWTKVESASMRGEAAKTSMSGLDYKNIWMTVTDGTPILQIFKGRISGEDIDMSADSEVFTKGKGTQTNPYLIENAEQLLYLVQSDATKGKYYALANDININDTSKKNWMYDNPTVWPVDQRTAAFAGTLDGMGYEIRGLFINEDPADPETLGGDANYVGGKAAGLFSYLDTAGTVRNVHIRNSFISGEGSVGAIAGHMTGNNTANAEIIGCSVDESVVIRGFTVGGLVGAGDRGVDIFFSYCTADLENSGPADRVNGLIGDIWSAKLNIMNCYVVGYRILRGQTSLCEAVYSDVHSASSKQVSLDGMYGSAAKTTMPDLRWDDVWYTVNGKTPQLKYVDYATRPVANDEGVKGRVWSGMIATKYAGGTGTESDPYIIETPEQLAMLVLNGGSTINTYYRLEADLKLNDTSKSGWEANARGWYTGTVFYGHFDGNGHVVSGLYYDKTDAGYCGLFPVIGHSSSIKRLGIAASSITNNAVSTQHTYAGALLGSLENWDGYNGKGIDGTKKAPVISECFIASDVTVTGDTVGGLLGGGAAGIEFYNCYSIPTLSYTYRGGGIFGDLWETNEGVVVVENCYVATTDRDPYGMGPKATEANTTLNNLYVDGPSTTAGNGEAIQLSLYFMQGDFAKDSLEGFDWNAVWKTVKGGTPVLRCFANAEKYTSKREPKKVSISFTTGSDASQHESIWGYPLVTEVNVEDFPIPTRYGYEFKGWSFFDTGDMMFDLEVFPNFDMYVFAVWEKLGFEQGFEGAMYPEYDVNAGAQFFRPGVNGYNPRFIHGGLRSMQTLAESTEAPMFLLYYEYKLEIGQQYDIKFFMTSRENGVSGKVEFLHANYADVNDEIVGYETALEFENLTSGKWEEYSYTITANAPYIIVRTTPGVELFFDDFSVVPTGTEGELGKLDGFNPDIIDAEPDGGLPIIWIIVIIVGGVVLLGGIATVVVILVKKGKKTAAPAEPTEPTPPENPTE